MLGRCAALARPGPRGVLVKLVKPGQDRRADLPTIGPGTITGTAGAQLRGVAFEAGGTILAEREATIAAAEKAELFLLGLGPDELRGEDT
jgi:UDP-2,3-diacylglucosamine hydrolase